MKKKGFTLIEILAVIVILAILLVMAVPKMLDVMKATKLSSIENSAKLIAKTAEQKKLENFPNFGDKCHEYDIIILQNMANVAAIADDNLAKYMLGARIDYIEEE